MGREGIWKVRERERGLVLIFSQWIWGDRVRVTCCLGGRNQEAESWEGLKAWRDMMGRWRWVCRVKWLQKGWHNLGGHLKEPEERDGCPSRESALPEISHQIGIFGNWLIFIHASNIGFIRPEPSEAPQKLSVVLHGLLIQSWRWYLSPCSPGWVHSSQHCPFLCVGLTSQPVSL